MQNLHLVKDRVMRGAVWRYFWLLVMDRKITSIQYMDFVQGQLGLETEDAIVQTVLMNLMGLINYYLPQELVHEKMETVFNILIDLLSKDGDIKKDPIVDNLFKFIATEEQLQMCIHWLNSDNKIVIQDKVVFTL